MLHYRVSRPQWVDLGRLVIAGDLLTLTTPKESMLGPVGKDFHWAKSGLCWRDAHTPKPLTHCSLMTSISFGIIDLVQHWFTRVNELTHWGWVTHICVSTTCQHCFRWWPAAWLAPSHYLNQYWNVVNWTLRNKLQWNLNQNSYLFIQGNAFKNIGRKLAAILSRPQCAKDIKKSVHSWPQQCTFFNRCILMLNSVRPDDTIWRHRTWSPLV